MDLLFPHHECEIAQNTASRGCSGVKYWMHNNMITIVIVAGRGQETTKGAVYATKYIHQLPVQITMTDNGTKAVVTAE